MDNDCSVFATANGPNGAGSHSLIRDTVDDTDNYQTIHENIVIFLNDQVSNI